MTSFSPPVLPGGHFNCADCQRPMTGFNEQRICRWYGLPPSPALAEDCTQFVPAVAPWFQGAWVCDSQGEGV